MRPSSRPVDSSLSTAQRTSLADDGSQALHIRLCPPQSVRTSSMRPPSAEHCLYDTSWRVSAHLHETLAETFHSELGVSKKFVSTFCPVANATGFRHRPSPTAVARRPCDVERGNSCTDGPGKDTEAEGSRGRNKAKEERNATYPMGYELDTPLPRRIRPKATLQPQDTCTQRAVHRADMPPSTGRSTPATKLLSSDERNSTADAISPGDPKRFKGIAAANRSRSSFA